MSEYRYVERETYEGKQHRSGGSTLASLKVMKHLPKVGQLKYVRGYVYRGRYNTTHVGVVVRGDKGYIRFGGFSWGYGGQGPRGLADLFKQLQIDVDPTSDVLGSNPCGADSGTKWKISLAA
jgi:hypothetical protein